MKNPYYSGPLSEHFDGLRFIPPGGARDKTRADLLKWQWGARTRPAWPKNFPAPERDTPPARVNGADIRVSYIGHASMLIQTHGINLLVDPVWAERASPFRFAGPRRVNAPGMRFDDLPPLDAILVSHNHYDHMDAATLKLLAIARPCPVLTPLGNDTILRAIDARIDARAFDWGARADIGPLRIHFEPALHWSARGLNDRRMALWCAFLIETPSANIYHVADTAFGDGAIFHALREKHTRVDLAILPIGAYAPRWFMRAQHVDPDESLAIFQIVGAECALAHHWGTFRLTDEPILEPVEKLAAALARENIAPERFATKRPGQKLTVKSGRATV